MHKYVRPETLDQLGPLNIFVIILLVVGMVLLAKFLGFVSMTEKKWDAYKKYRSSTVTKPPLFWEKIRWRVSLPAISLTVAIVGWLSFYLIPVDLPVRKGISLWVAGFASIIFILLLLVIYDLKRQENIELEFFSEGSTD